MEKYEKKILEAYLNLPSSNGILPHKHNFVINNGFVNKGSVDDINYLLWLLFGNRR